MVLSLKDILNGPHEYRNGQYFPLPKPVVEDAAAKPVAQTAAEYERSTEAQRLEKLKGKK